MTRRELLKYLATELVLGEQGPEMIGAYRELCADAALGAAVKADGWDADMWNYAAESLEKFPEPLEGLILKCRVIADALEAGQKEEKQATCQECGQKDHGQTGEYPCHECGLPTVWDTVERGNTDDKR